MSDGRGYEDRVIGRLARSILLDKSAPFFLATMIANYDSETRGCASPEIVIGVRMNG